MKTAVLALALLSSCVFAAHAGSGRRLHQSAPAGAPADCPTVYEVAESAGLTQLVQAMELDQLDSSLNNNSRYPLTYTVFAPTDEALTTLLTEEGTTLEALQETGDLNSILQYHFLITPYTEAQLNSFGTVGTNFRNQTLSIADGVITAFASNATITQADIPACRSIIHIIDNVLIPNFGAVAPPPGELGPTASSS